MGTRTSTEGADRSRLALALRCLDLTALNDTDDARVVRSLARRALDPAPGVDHVAAVCTWPRLIEDATALLEGTPVAVAGVAGDFPAGRAPLEEKLEEIRAVRGAGATEVDAVIDWVTFLEDDAPALADEVVAFKQAAGRATLKVILETGGLGAPERIRRASYLAMEGGADMLKTSTGKLSPGATPESVRAVAEAIRDFSEDTGRIVGLKVSGGVRWASDALAYMQIVESTLGSDAFVRSRFRIGASALLDDLARRLGDGPAAGA